MSPLERTIILAVLVACLAGAGFWLWDFLIDSPGNLDEIVIELRRLGKVNAIAGVSVLIATLAAFYAGKL